MHLLTINIFTWNLVFSAMVLLDFPSVINAQTGQAVYRPGSISVLFIFSASFSYFHFHIFTHFFLKKMINISAKMDVISYFPIKINSLSSINIKIALNSTVFTYVFLPNKRLASWWQKAKKKLSFFFVVV